jgi:hypothetical protein
MTSYEIFSHTQEIPQRNMALLKLFRKHAEHDDKKYPRDEKQYGAVHVHRHILKTTQQLDSSPFEPQPYTVEDTI